MSQEKTRLLLDKLIEYFNNPSKAVAERVSIREGGTLNEVDNPDFWQKAGEIYAERLNGGDVNVLYKKPNHDNETKITLQVDRFDSKALALYGFNEEDIKKLSLREQMIFEAVIWCAAGDAVKKSLEPHEEGHENGLVDDIDFFNIQKSTQKEVNDALNFIFSSIKEEGLSFDSFFKKEYPIAPNENLIDKLKSEKIVNASESIENLSISLKDRDSYLVEKFKKFISNAGREGIFFPEQEIESVSKQIKIPNVLFPMQEEGMEEKYKKYEILFKNHVDEINQGRSFLEDIEKNKLDGKTEQTIKNMRDSGYIDSLKKDPHATARKVLSFIGTVAAILSIVGIGVLIADKIHRGTYGFGLFDQKYRQNKQIKENVLSALKPHENEVTEKQSEEKQEKYQEPSKKEDKNKYDNGIYQDDNTRLNEIESNPNASPEDLDWARFKNGY